MPGRQYPYPPPSTSPRSAGEAGVNSSARCPPSSGGRPWLSEPAGGVGPLASGVLETGFAAREASSELAAPVSQPSLLECYWTDFS